MTSAQFRTVFFDLSAIDNSHQFCAIYSIIITMDHCITINILSALNTVVYMHFFLDGITAGFKFQF